MLQRQRRGMS